MNKPVTPTNEINVKTMSCANIFLVALTIEINKAAGNAIFKTSLFKP